MYEPNLVFAGTPLVPPSYLTAYFGIFFLLLLLTYIYFYRKRKPILLWQKVKLLLVLAVIIKATALLGGLIVAVYWLIPSPGIRRIIPQKETLYSPTNKIEIVFDKPINRWLLEKSISPDTPGVWVFENSIYTTHLYRKLVFYPSYSLRPDTTYTVNLNRIQNLLKISKSYEYQYEFTTQHSPKILAVSPVSGEGAVETSAKIKVTLDNPNNRISDFEFQFTPNLDYEVELDESKTVYTITPKTSLEGGTEYNFKIQKSDLILNLEDGNVIERGNAEVIYNGSFTTKKNSTSYISTVKQILTDAPPKILSITPENNWSAVNVYSPVKVTFDQVVDHTSSQQKFAISPTIEGNFSWEGNTLIFTPKSPYSFSTTYKVTLGDFETEFSTQNATTKLAVPAYLQKYTLSCEIASLRMALNYRGLNTTEDELIPKVGLDPTPHNGNTWGNPYNAFVGNIRGTQMVDGYGVYWGPIARTARDYREAKDFQGWSINELTGEIAAGNPVIIWVYSHLGRATSWNTPEGTNIYAVRDEHAVVATGFVGPKDNPTQIIINDPLIGQVYWSRSTFDKKWNIFNRSGVVIY